MIKKKITFAILILCCILCSAKDSPDMTVTVSGKDFYYASLAYKDYSSQGRIIFRQDKERVDARINYLKSIKEKYKIPMSRQELAELSREELYDYNAVKHFLSVPEELYREKSFSDLNEYKFEITYDKETVKVFMYIDNPSVRGGGATYIFDYDGNMVNKEYYK